MSDLVRATTPAGHTVTAERAYAKAQGLKIADEKPTSKGGQPIPTTYATHKPTTQPKTTPAADSKE